jgi:uncharacterized membrane protein YfcA
MNRLTQRENAVIEFLMYLVFGAALGTLGGIFGIGGG